MDMSFLQLLVGYKLCLNLYKDISFFALFGYFLGKNKAPEGA